MNNGLGGCGTCRKVFSSVSSHLAFRGLIVLCVCVLAGSLSAPVMADPPVVGPFQAWGDNFYGQLGNGTTADSSLAVEIDMLAGAPEAAGGANHSLALKADGTVWAWGYNNSGQVGDNTFTTRLTPVQVVGLADCVGVSAGNYFSTALRADGTVWAWGYNYYGQLGDGSTLNRSVPVQVIGLRKCSAVAARNSQALALASDGTVWAWGSNVYGQLGDGSTTDRYTPVAVLNLSDCTAVAAGWTHSFAVKSDGTVWAWGNNRYGQLGDGTTATRLSPVRATALTSVKAIAAGGTFSMILKTDGTVWTWGENNMGQLGDGTRTNRVAPAQVVGLPPCVAVAAGNEFAVAVAEDGTVWSWGNNINGQLGDGTVTIRTAPVRVVDVSQVETIACGYCHALASSLRMPLLLLVSANPTEAGNVVITPERPWYWAGAEVAVEAFEEPTWRFVGFSGLPSGAVSGEGNVISFSINENLDITANFVARVDDFTVTADVFPPASGTVHVTPDKPFYTLGESVTVEVVPADGYLFGYWSGDTRAVTETHTFQIIGDMRARAIMRLHRESEIAWGWGDNSNGQVGDGTTTQRDVAAQVSSLATATALAAGGTHSLALTADRTVRAWGNNGSGQLGDGTTSGGFVPVQVVGPDGQGALDEISLVAAGQSHSLALKSNGTVWAWGHNGYGQIGDGATGTNQLTPVQVLGPDGLGYLTDVIGIAAGNGHSLALKVDGTVWAWGYNNYGQLGDGTTSGCPTPVQVKGAGGTGFLTGIVALQAGGLHSLALKSDGTVWAWGCNGNGRLGDATVSTRLTPVQVVGLGGVGVLTDVVAIDGGLEYSLALKSDGTVWAWGRNINGQLGDGTAVDRDTPVQVRGEDNQGYLTNILSVSAGYRHALAVKADGTLWAWGSNAYGQLGNEFFTTQTSPVRVLGLVDAWAVAGGSGHSLALGSTETHTVTIDADPMMAGTISITPNRDEYLDGCPVMIEASSYPGWRLAGFSGLPAGVVDDGGGQVSFSVLEDCHVTARFVLEQEGLTLAVNVFPSDGGIVTVTPDKTFYEPGESVTLEATPAADYVWSHWTGDVWGRETALTFQITRNTSVTAVMRGGPASSASPVSWGYNTHGQLGDGTNDDRSYPGPVDIASGPLSVAAGNSHSMLLNSDGTVWAWGGNYRGQLGDGTNIQRSTPVQVQGPGGAGFLTDVVAIAGGGAHSLAVRSDGTVWAWGYNDYGQLGDGTVSSTRWTPVQVKGPGGLGFLTDVVSVAGGNTHSMALKSDGTVWAWGSNEYGKLGDGTSVSSRTPVQVHGPAAEGVLTDVVAIAAGIEHSLAVRADGTVWAWGYNGASQLGDGTTTWRSTPVQVKGPDGQGGLSGIVCVAAGEPFSMAVAADGSVWAWGSNYYGQLGDGTTASTRKTPVQVVAGSGSGFLGDVVTIAAGKASSFAVKADGTVWAWGRNERGHLGDGTTTNRNVPVRVIGLYNAARTISSGDMHCLAVSDILTYTVMAESVPPQGGTVTKTPDLSTYCDGQPVTIHAEANPDALFVGFSGLPVDATDDGMGTASFNVHDDVHVMALFYMLPRYTVAVAADPSYGGVITVSPQQDDYWQGELVTVEAAPYPGWSLVGLSGLPGYAVSGGVGVVSFNVQEDVEITAHFVMQREGFTLAASVFPPGSATLTVDPNKTLYDLGETVHLEVHPAAGYEFVCWRGDLDGRDPVQDYVITRDSSLTALMRPIRPSGPLCAWGANAVGELGDGSTTSSHVPVPLASPSDCIAVSGGRAHTLALASNGTVWAWGLNDRGQLGDGTLVDSHLPRQIALNDVVAIAAGYEHSVALKADGTVWTWGGNSRGQLGDGTTWPRYEPIQVAGPDGQGHLDDIVAVAAGDWHCLAVKSDGTVWAWGRNTGGRLGDATGIDRLWPVQVHGVDNEGFLQGIAAVAAGGAHSLALKSDGTVWSWGENAYGQLGDGTYNSHWTPIQVVGPAGVGYLEGIAAIASGGYHSLAVKTGGTVWAWGSNGYGTLGDGTGTPRPVPVQVHGVGNEGFLENVVTINGGYRHSLAVQADGTLCVWGRNNSGQLGDGTTTNRFTPIRLVDVVSARAANGGEEHTIAIAEVPYYEVTVDLSQVGSGTVSKSPDIPLHRRGSSVTIEAAPNSGWEFVGFSGLPSGASIEGEGVVSFNVLADAHVTAVFAMTSNYFVLNRTAFPQGHGQVAATPDRLMFSYGEHVTVQADPGEGYTFSHWLGDLSGSEPTHELVMNHNYSVTAVMKPARTAAAQCAWGAGGYGQLGQGTVIGASPGPLAIGTLSDCLAVATGSFHSVALRGDGTVWTCGYNNYGQLGDGTTTDGLAPVQVRGLDGEGFLSGMTAVAAGYGHSMALASDGTVWAWGYNYYGQVGSGTTTDCLTPVQVKGLDGEGLLTDVVAIAAGASHSLAVRSDGSVWAWGNNGAGRLGDGTATSTSTPIQVHGPSGVGFLANFVAVAAGNSHSMALRADGTVWAWGSNEYGKLGDGTVIARYTPVLVVGSGGYGLFSGVVSLAAGGDHSVALKSDGTVWAWGRNDRSQLGNGTTTQSDTPSQVKGSGGTGVLTAIVAIGSGESHCLALASDGAVWAWGDNSSGQLGDATFANRSCPARVLALTGATSVGTGKGVHSLALGTVTRHLVTVDAVPSAGGTVTQTPERSLYWDGESLVLQASAFPGWDFVGFSGLPAGVSGAGQSEIAFNVLEELHITANFAMQRGGFIVDARVWPAGSGILTVGPEKDLYDFGETVTVEVQPVAGYEFAYWVGDITGSGLSIAFNTTRDCTIAAVMRRTAPPAGSVCAWGSNASGQLGDGTTTSSKGPVGTGLSGYVDVATKLSHSLALRQDGTVWAWGDNTNGPLGDGTAIARLTPVQVHGPGDEGFLTDVAAVAAGYSCSMALRSDGTVWTWGYNSHGKLGDGTIVSSPTPIQVHGPGEDGFLHNVVAIAAGDSHGLAVRYDGTVWAWGYNSTGQLGDGTTTDRLTPVQVRGPGGEGFLQHIVAVSAGNSHSLAVASDGTVWAWGSNIYGRLGDGTSTDASLPVQVRNPDGSGWLTGVAAVAAGSSHSLALKADGTVWAWGYNLNGQLGDATSTTRLLPSQVRGPAGVGMLTDAVAVAAGGYHSLAIRADADRTALAWGRNTTSQLGDATTLNRLVPTSIVGLQNATCVAGGTDHSLAIGDVVTHHLALTVDPTEGGTATVTPDRAAYWHQETVTLEAAASAGWSFGGWSGLPAGCDPAAATVSFNIESDLDITAHFATEVGGLLLTVRVFPPDGGTVVVTPDKPGYSFGESALLEAQPADGYRFSRWLNDLSGSDPTQPITITRDTVVTAVMERLPGPGQLCVWGGNAYGQLGDGGTSNVTVPIELSGMTDCLALAAGTHHSLIVRSDGSVWTWGRNNYGQLGDGGTTDRSTPAAVAGLSDCTAVAGGAAFSLALAADGTVWAWGRNSYGQLGDGTNTHRYTPVQVSGLSGVMAIAAGDLHSLAVKSDGTVWAWGYNYYGQLGDGTNTHRYTPVQVTAITDCVALAAGAYHSLALLSDGTVRSWGNSNYGQLGNGLLLRQNLPVTVSGLSGIVAVTSRSQHSLAVSSEGTVWAWGRNNYGQLGDGTTTNRLIAIPVGVFEDHAAPSAGTDCSYALYADESVRGLGYNNAGQLGDGTTTNRMQTVRTLGLAEASNVVAGGNHAMAIGHVLSHTLSTEVVPADRGSLSVAPDLGTYWHGQTVTLEATPVPGSKFVGYSGLPAGYDAEQALLSFQIVDDTHVVAMFDVFNPHLTIVPHAGGDVTGDPEGDYTYNATVHLHQTTIEGYRFVHWLVNGAEFSTADDIELTMNEDKTVEAVFAYQCTLTVINGTGSGIYDEGTVVEIAANWPAAQFATWSGDTSTVTDPLSATTTITVNADCTVTAVPMLTDVIEVTADYDWVYQNTPVLMGRGGHRVRLEVTVSSAMGNETFEVTVEKVDGSGPGEVTVGDDPDGDPLVKMVYGGLRTDGVAGSGDLTLRATVTGDVAGEATRDVPLMVRRLGDMNGDGGVEPSDMSLLIRRLNMLPVDGYEDRHFDLDLDGGVQPGDRSLLINILNVLPVP